MIQILQIRKIIKLDLKIKNVSESIIKEKTTIGSWGK